MKKLLIIVSFIGAIGNLNAMDQEVKHSTVNKVLSVNYPRAFQQACIKDDAKTASTLLIAHAEKFTDKILKQLFGNITDTTLNELLKALSMFILSKLTLMSTATESEKSVWGVRSEILEQLHREKKRRAAIKEEEQLIAEELKREADEERDNNSLIDEELHRKS